MKGVIFDFRFHEKQIVMIFMVFCFHEKQTVMIIVVKKCVQYNFPAAIVWNWFIMRL